MEIIQKYNILIFIVFFIPGFISIKVYGLLIPGERKDSIKLLYEAIAYSAINYVLLSWLIIFVFTNSFYRNNPFLFYLSVLFVMLIAPMIWPILYKWLSKRKFLSKYIIHPILKPWDYVFNQKKVYWVIVHLKNGKKIGGKYWTKSFASSYPADEQIFLEEVWELDSKERFIKPIERSAGIIILKDDIEAIELFKS